MIHATSSKCGIKSRPGKFKEKQQGQCSWKTVSCISDFGGDNKNSWNWGEHLA